MTAPLLHLTVPGRPVPKGRPRLGAGRRTYTPARTEAAEAAVGWRARARWAGAPTLQLLRVDLELHLCGGTVGDVDNYAKLVLDALQGIVYANDRQVRELRAVMVDAPDAGQERTRVTVLPYVAPVSTPLPEGATR